MAAFKFDHASEVSLVPRGSWLKGIPHNAALANEAVPPKGNHNSMSRASTPEVPTNDSTTGYYSFPSEDDILGTRNICASGNLIPSVLNA